MADQALNNIKFLDRDPPTFSEEEARQIAVDLYGLRGEFKPLKSERDQNFSIDTERDGSYVLKLSNAAEDPGVIDFQTQALARWTCGKSFSVAAVIRPSRPYSSRVSAIRCLSLKYKKPGSGSRVNGFSEKW